MFAHEKLKVYDKALTSAASLAQCSGLWDKRHSVSDQLLRASESLVLNLAEAARLRSAAKRQHQLDYAIGSALECAACPDIASLKQLLACDSAFREKVSLCEVVKMLVGLRQAWASNEFRISIFDFALNLLPPDARP
jgi:four helix bundle protein